MDNFSCPLCEAFSFLYVTAHNKEYFRCTRCALIFLPERYFPSPEAEKARYLHHHNTLTEPGYLTFLDQLLVPLVKKIPPSATGLDYGSGPKAIAAHRLCTQGYTVHTFDPYFCDDQEVLKNKYAFIICTEVVEHFKSPQKSIEEMISLLAPQGTLGIMTAFAPDTVDAFKKWYYIRDNTHLCFYSEATFHWIAANYNLNLESDKKRVVFLELVSKKHC